MDIITLNNTTNSLEPKYNFTRFVVLQTFVTFFTIISAYITTALSFFEYKLRSKCKLQSKRSWTERKGRYAMAMRYESIVAALFLLGRLLCEQYELLAQYLGLTYDYCDVIVKVKVSLSYIAVSSVYLFLWTRQRLCYSEPVLHHLSSQLMKAMSWISLLLLAVAQVASTILFLVTRFYKMTYLGCGKHMSTTPDKVPWMVIGVMTVCFQLFLFFLFVFPLIKHKSAMESEPKVAMQKVFRLIKRAAVMTTVCFVTDIISFLLILFVRDNYEIVMILAYDVSLVTNVICVVASFSDWKSRFFAPIYSYKNAARHSSTVSHNTKNETTRSRDVFALTSPSRSCKLSSTNIGNSSRITNPEPRLNGPLPANQSPPSGPLNSLPQKISVTE